MTRLIEGKVYQLSDDAGNQLLATYRDGEFHFEYGWLAGVLQLESLRFDATDRFQIREHKWNDDLVAAKDCSNGQTA